jgi:hypothetical protein
MQTPVVQRRGFRERSVEPSDPAMTERLGRVVCSEVGGWNERLPVPLKLASRIGSKWRAAMGLSGSSVAPGQRKH